ncbi:YolD-like family protein [Bacillus subtilis]|nr:YolD-like family protein [Bacillus subtilis]MDM5301922.1 YolD-like family protein [Bacillus subtilis]MDM5323975.1 YolD-like family protein [Bacillus subtilis]
MIRDRDRIKWTSMILPKYVKFLMEYNKSLDKVKKTVLDDQKYEEFNEIICGAMEENITLQFTFYQKGEMKKLLGNIHYIDQLKRELRIVITRLKNMF